MYFGNIKYAELRKGIRGQIPLYYSNIDIHTITPKNKFARLGLIWVWISGEIHYFLKSKFRR